MTDIEEFIMSSYEEKRVLSNTNISQVALVQNRFDDKLYIRRTLPKDCTQLYQALKDCPFSGIPAIYEIIYDGKTVVFEEYIDGRSLFDLSQGEIFPADFSLYMTSLLEILDKLHERRIIHRDIKEENILICSDKRMVLIDFAISKLETEDEDISENTLGTVTAAAPEQFGLAPTDCRSDIYSFGILCRSLLKCCLRLSSTEKNMWKAVSDKCTEFKPQNRYQSVSEILRIVRQPALFHGLENEHLITFAHMEYPPCLQLNDNEEKEVTAFSGFDSITLSEKNGQIHIQLSTQNDLYSEVIFPAIKDNFTNHHTTTELFFLQDSLLIVRAFYISTPQIDGICTKRTDYYQVRQIFPASVSDVRLSEIYENLTGYTVLGEAEILLDRDNLAEFVLNY